MSSFIPKDVLSIIDVGCGIGGNTKYLLEKGYELETLSPDKFQNKVIDDKFKNKIIFHRTKFEDFHTEKKYDLILESESACYIDMKKVFQKQSKFSGQMDTFFLQITSFTIMITLVVFI